MINKRKYFLLLSAVILIITFSVSAVLIKSASKANLAQSANVKLPTVIVDAGHGGFDGGAVASDGTMEKDINLKIATHLQEELTKSGYNVLMTRTTDTATDDETDSKIRKRKRSDLQNRLKMMNENPDAIFVSIHLNKFTSTSVSGAQVFYSKNNPNSKNLGQAIQTSFVKNLQKENKRVIKQATKSTYLLYNAQLPAIIVECGFLSNSEELKQLKDENYQKMVAQTIFCGINNYYNKQF